MGALFAGRGNAEAHNSAPVRPFAGVVRDVGLSQQGGVMGELLLQKEAAVATPPSVAQA